MLGAGDDLVLEGGGQVAEVVAVTGHAHDQVAVRLGAGLGVSEGLGADVITSSLSYKDWYTYEDMDGDTAVITIAADLAAANGIATSSPTDRRVTRSSASRHP